jgi:hypothetical protein
MDKIVKEFKESEERRLSANRCNWPALWAKNHLDRRNEGFFGEGPGDDLFSRRSSLASRVFVLLTTPT